MDLTLGNLAATEMDDEPTEVQGGGAAVPPEPAVQWAFTTARPGTTERKRVMEVDQPSGYASLFAAMQEEVAPRLQSPRLPNRSRPRLPPREEQCPWVPKRLPLPVE
ncbi:unnamed protein product [Effrenium voratum]|uniref:Uncharacterized protein n=1 Tax=Effrenium voratum TaxID=2562239 RepID=A0AA36JLM6_9DINO|nr:unnamed protein product [Effrenium voratum]